MNRVGNVGSGHFGRQRIRVRRASEPDRSRRANGLVDALGLSSCACSPEAPPGNCPSQEACDRRACHGDHGDRAGGGQHGRHRRVHEPRLPGQGPAVGLRPADAVGGGRHHRAVRRLVLCGACDGIPEVGRGIQLSVAHLPQGRRVSRRLGIGHGRLLGAHGARGHGVRRLLQRRRAGCAPAAAGAAGGVVGVA